MKIIIEVIYDGMEPEIQDLKNLRDVVYHQTVKIPAIPPNDRESVRRAAVIVSCLRGMTLAD